MSHTYSKFYDKAKEVLDEMQKEFISNPSDSLMAEMKQLAWLFTNAATWADGIMIDREKFAPKSGQVKDFISALKYARSQGDYKIDYKIGEDDE